jgi:beta-barrel assembly-enhancing protease
VISQGTQFGLGTAFLRFSREYEKQADILGSHIMAAAGYDPRSMANMFKTIESQAGEGGPQWLSDHPNPGNRSEYILAEAKTLEVGDPVHDQRSLESVQADLRRLPPARTTAQIMKNAEQSGSAETGGNADPRAGAGQTTGTGGRLSTNVEPPASRFRTYSDQGGSFRVSVPENWRQVSNGNTLRFVPDGAYASSGGREVFTHGIELGVTQAPSADLRDSTNQLVESLSKGNPQLRADTAARPVSFAGRQGLQVRLSNTSEATGAPEVVVLTTVLLEDGSLAYSIGVAPASQFGTYRDTIDRVNQSVVFGR